MILPRVSYITIFITWCSHKSQIKLIAMEIILTDGRFMALLLTAAAWQVLFIVMNVDIILYTCGIDIITLC